MRKILAIILVFILAISQFYVIAGRAASIEIVLGDDKATIHVDISVNLTRLPASVVAYYGWIKQLWAFARSTLNSLLTESIQKYLREKMGIHNATVLNLDMNIDMTTGTKTATIHPSSMTNTTGTLVSGGIESLMASDGVVARFSSFNNSNTMIIIVDINITLPPELPDDKITGLTLFLVGKLSKTVNSNASIEIYDYSTNTYKLLGNDLNTTSFKKIEYTITDATNFVKDRTIRVRIHIVDTQSYPSTTVHLDLDEVGIKLDYFTAILKLTLDMTLTGISNSTLLARYYNVKFRYMNPDIEVEYNGIKLSLSTELLLNLTAFKVPLDKWERKYNGTHTIFTLTLPSVTIPIYGGYQVTIDPTESIIVEGLAVANGDVIVVEQLTSSPLLVFGLLVVLIIAVIAIAKAMKHTIVEEMKKKRRFVKKKY